MAQADQERYDQRCKVSFLCHEGCLASIRLPPNPTSLPMRFIGEYLPVIRHVHNTTVLAWELPLNSFS